MPDMQMEDGRVYGQFDSGAVNINGGAAWEQVGDDLNISDMGGDVFLEVYNAGPSALTDFKIMWASQQGGEFTDWRSGADFASPTVLTPFTAAVNTLAAGARAKLVLAGLEAVSELQFWAKSVNADVQITGAVRK